MPRRSSRSSITALFALMRFSRAFARIAFSTRGGMLRSVIAFMHHNMHHTDATVNLRSRMPEMATAAIVRARMKQLTAALSFVAAAAFAQTNPFFNPSALPYQAPPFNQIRDADYQPALEEGMKRGLAEIEAIANSPDPPTFEPTPTPMMCGSAFARRSSDRGPRRPAAKAYTSSYPSSRRTIGPSVFSSRGALRTGWSRACQGPPRSTIRTVSSGRT